MSITPNKTTVTVDYTKYALALFNAGFNVVPMRSDSKAPALPTWKQYTQQRQTEEEILSFSWSQNIAIINGIGDLHSFDLDQCTDLEVLFKLLELLGLEPNYPWVVHTPGKGGGFHIHFLSTGNLTLTHNGVLVGKPIEPNTFQQIELRWKDCLTMFPFSIHPEANQPYEWAFGLPTTPIAVIPVEVV